MAGPLDPGPGIPLDPAFNRVMGWAYLIMGALALISIAGLIAGSVLGLGTCK